jgi:hypothetical protein
MDKSHCRHATIRRLPETQTPQEGAAVITVTEESQLSSIEATLLRTYGERLPPDRIRSEFEASRARFRDARIRTFVPVLVQREAVERLRRLPQAVAA